MVRNAMILGAGEECLRPRGPHPKSDSWGMLLACTMLVRSLDEGKNAPKVQFHTIRRARAAYTSYVHTCEDGMGDSFVAQTGSLSGRVSLSPAQHPWFARFF